MFVSRGGVEACKVTEEEREHFYAHVLVLIVHPLPVDATLLHPRLGKGDTGGALHDAFRDAEAAHDG